MQQRSQPHLRAAPSRTWLGSVVESHTLPFERGAPCDYPLQRSFIPTQLAGFSDAVFYLVVTGPCV